MKKKAVSTIYFLCLTCDDSDTPTVALASFDKPGALAAERSQLIGPEGLWKDATCEGQNGALKGGNGMQ